jgi:hypothetical protein
MRKLHYRRLPVLAVQRSAAHVSPSGVSAIIATGNVDRYGTIIDPRGMVADNFARNPVLLYQHGQDAKVGSWPVGRVLQLALRPIGIQADIEFDLASALHGDQQVMIGAELARLYTQGWLRAFSIGFIPLESASDSSGALCYTSWELAELSCVAVPGDPGALVVDYDIDTAEAIDVYGGDPDRVFGSPGE